MWISILINIICSILIIIIGHYLWIYMKETYSEKKVKDVLGSQTQKYKTIIDKLQQNKQINPIEDDETDLKDDLEQFLQETMTQF